MLQRHSFFLSLFIASTTCFAPVEDPYIGLGLQPRHTLILRLTDYNCPINHMDRSLLDLTTMKCMLPTLEQVKVFPQMCFAQFEHEKLPQFLSELKEHENNQQYRNGFKMMLFQEVFRKISTFSVLANEFAQKKPELPLFVQQQEALWDKLKIHDSAINELLDQPEINYVQLAQHCIEKTRICCSVTELILSLYEEQG